MVTVKNYRLISLLDSFSKYNNSIYPTNAHSLLCKTLHRFANMLRVYWVYTRYTQYTFNIATYYIRPYVYSIYNSITVFNVWGALMMIPLDRNMLANLWSVLHNRVRICWIYRIIIMKMHGTTHIKTFLRFVNLLYMTICFVTSKTNSILLNIVFINPNQLVPTWYPT
jgi:hypothetical protein